MKNRKTRNATPDLHQIRQRLRRFSAERDWERFHSPKNLSIAVVVEAAELAEHFQWLSIRQSEHLSEKIRQQVEEEIADVFLYLVRLADKLGVNLLPYFREGVNTVEHPLHGAEIGDMQDALAPFADPAFVRLIA